MTTRSQKRKVLFVGNNYSKTIPRSSNQNGNARRTTKKMTTRLSVWADENEDDVETISRNELDPLSFGGNTTASIARERPYVPELFRLDPLIKDRLMTTTSKQQDDVVARCLPLLGLTDKANFGINSHGIPKLEREEHVIYLEDLLHKAHSPIPFDSSRPWLLYWSLTGLYLLGEDISTYRESVNTTLSPSQNPEGGFGGGHGQLSHVAATYAAILSLIMVGGAESLNMIDRRGLWRWLGEVKESDGGFRMSVGGEEDVRGAYCSMVIITLLALPLELPPNAPSRANGFNSFLDGLPEYLSRCQTFEGGISCKPQTEAHGGYAFIALACLSIVGPPQETIPKYLDLPLLISWLAARQYAPEGGYSGRTNKLVDGCYSHWVGGCWPIIEAALNGSKASTLTGNLLKDSLYSKEGLTRYILSCCQDDGGGLRDKPSAFPDAYHTCYTLAGLSSTQYRDYFTGTRDSVAGYPLDWALRWSFSKGSSSEDRREAAEEWADEGDTVKPLHPIYAMPWEAVERCHTIFSQKSGF